jgi:hypothetical protein
MLRDGMDVYTVADIAGHSTIDLLKFYITGADDKTLAAAMRSTARLTTY